MVANARSRGGAPVHVRKLVMGFIAGFIAVLLFHQPALAVLAKIGFVQAGTYSMAAAGPLHVPQVVSLAFWGGVWGVLFAAIEHRFPRGAMYWVYALAFGAILPSLVAWFVVAPMKGLPMAAGWQASRMATGLIINGAWGVGTALLFSLTRRIG
ncbi:MAG: hypothetical protein JWM26_3839 [Betaproteobacteria bacterium]|nr:hypothetical protein [Betaproteobacteria bacterium]